MDIHTADNRSISSAKPPSKKQGEAAALTTQLALVGGSTEGELKRAGAELAAAARERAALEAQLAVVTEQLAATRAGGDALAARVLEAERGAAEVRRV